MKHIEEAPMPDKRTVDELSIEELEQVLAIKKRQVRQDRLTRMKHSGRVMNTSSVSPNPANTFIPSTTARGDAPMFEDGIQNVNTPKRKNNGIWQRFVDRSLLLVEVVAVFGLVGIGVVFVNGVGLLQRETADVQAAAEEAIRASMPTLAPTPTIQLANVVLPGGHTSPLEVNGGQFNFEEIPASLRPLLQDQIFLPPNISRPPTLPETPIRLIIPDLNIDQSIVQGVDWEALKLGVGQLPNNAVPTDTNANIVLAAHNDIYGELFRHIDQLEVGMVFQIQTQTRYYDYVVTGSDQVQPDDVYVMDPRGYRAVTLISCYPYQVNNLRYIVYAEQVSS
jgi:sortase A